MRQPCSQRLMNALRVCSLGIEVAPKSFILKSDFLPLLHPLCLTFIRDILWSGGSLLDASYCVLHETAAP